MKWLLDKIGGAFIGQFVRMALSIFVPLLAPALVALAGIAQNVEWYLWISAALVSFWFCLSSVNQFNQISSRMSSKWKLSQTAINVMVFASNKNEPPFWTETQVEIVLLNRAEFPIEYEFELINARMGNSINIDAKYINRGGLLDPGTGSSFTTEAISMGDLVVGAEVSGEWSFVIKYGRPGAMRHKLFRRCHVVGRVGPGRLPEGVRWYYLPAKEIKLLT